MSATPLRRIMIVLAAWPALFCAATSMASGSGLYVDSGGNEYDFVRMDDAGSAVRHGHYSAAIAKLGEVIAASPNFADAYFVRAGYYRDAGRFNEAIADLDHAKAFHPDASEIEFMRATIALRQHDAPAALSDLETFAKMPLLSAWKHSRYAFTVHGMSFALAYTSIAQQMLGHNEAAFEAFSHELDFENDHPYYVLAAHCYTAAIVGLLDMAELTCGEAISKQTHDIGDYDSLGLAHLKMGKWTQAIGDYNRSLYDRPDLTLSLYGRGIARLATGDRAGGMADIAAAKQGEPDIANIMASMGVKAPTDI